MTKIIAIAMVSSKMGSGDCDDSQLPLLKGLC